VCSDYRSIDDGANFINLELKLLEYSEPDAAIRPVGKPVVDRLPRTKALRQIAPRNACLRTVENRVDELPVANLGSRPLPLLWKQLVKLSPLFVGQSVSVHRKLGSHL
jgi:hypothetical protein